MTNARMVGVFLLVAACSSGDDDAMMQPDGGNGSGECTAPTGTFHGQTLANGDGKEDRYYLLHVPASYHCEPMPLLVDFHGTAEDMPEEAYQTDALIEFADAHGVIVARPRSRSSIEGTYTIYRWDQNPGDLLYAWHFGELWQFLDAGVPPNGGAIAAPWTIAALPSAADVLALARDGSTLVAAGAHGRTWRRDMAGAWTLDLDRSTADYTALCFNGTHGFVGGDYTAVHRTGTTWSTDQQVPDYGMQLGLGWVNAAVCRGDGSVVVAGYWSAAATSDAGAHWSKVGIDVGGYNAQIAGAAAAAGATVLVGYYDYVGAAATGSTAATAAQTPGEVEWWNASAAVGATVWAVGDGGAIARSNDNGATWTSQSSGTGENLYGVAFADASYGVAVGRRGTVLITTDGGALWTPRSLGKDLFLGAVAIDATTITVAGEDGVIATSPR